MPFPGPDEELTKNPTFSVSMRRGDLDRICRYHLLSYRITIGLANLLADFPEDLRQFSRFRKRWRAETIYIPGQPPPMNDPNWATTIWPQIPIRVAFDRIEAQSARRWLATPGGLSSLSLYVQYALRDEILDWVRNPPRGRDWKTLKLHKVLAASLFFAHEFVVSAQENQQLVRKIEDLLTDYAQPSEYLIDFGGDNRRAMVVALVIHGMAGAKHMPQLADISPDRVFRRYLYGPRLQSLKQETKAAKEFDQKYSLKTWDHIRYQWEARLLADRPGQIARDFFLK